MRQKLRTNAEKAKYDQNSEICVTEMTETNEVEIKLFSNCWPISALSDLTTTSMCDTET